MTLERIGDVSEPCLSPSHNPPGNIVLKPGVYRHTCPACGKTSTFTVYGTTC